MPEVVLIGAGNVGTHLGRRLHDCGIAVRQVFSRRISKAERLARQIEAQAIDQWHELYTEAALYILAVSDDAIAEVGRNIQAQLPAEAFVVHTSGATPSTALQGFRRYGVFYLLQTFSREKAVDFSAIPVCVSANQPKDELILEKLGQKISDRVFIINDHERAVLHIAAVFANNFVNHCFQISHQILEREQLPFELLQPLIQETARKITAQTPADMQTGPAVRGDVATIRRHLDYLEATNSPYRELYRQLSKSIRPSLKIED
jgi:predicted short-subunit dehydrogenase-like oxidoreductase (DUF2520 family)